MLIRPIVTNAPETWVLNVINKLMILERRIMRKIFGPTRTDGATGGLNLMKKSTKY